MGRRSREKGAVFERDLARRFRELTGDDQIRRGRQDGKDRFVGNHHEGDVVGVPGVFIEAKWCKQPSLGTWWRQLELDVAGTGLEPLLVFRWDRGPVLFSMRARAVDRWADSLVDFSLTATGSKVVRWEQQLPKLGELRVIVTSDAVVVGRWEVFEELWRSHDS